MGLPKEDCLSCPAWGDWYGQCDNHGAFYCPVIENETTATPQLEDTTAENEK